MLKKIMETPPLQLHFSGSVTFCLVHFRLVLIRLVLIRLVHIRLVHIRLVLIRLVLIRLVHIRLVLIRLVLIRLVHIRLVLIRNFASITFNFNKLFPWFVFLKFFAETRTTELNSLREKDEHIKIIKIVFLYN